MVLTAIFFLTLCGAARPGVSEGDKLFKKAELLDEKANYTKAGELYKKARAQFMKDGEEEKSDDCRIRLQRIEKIVTTYPHTEAEAKKILGEQFPKVPESRINGWFRKGEIEHLTIDGTPHYYGDMVKSMKYRHLDLMRSDPEMMERYRKFYTALEKIISEYAKQAPPAEPWEPYIDPVNYSVRGAISIARKELPATGLLKVWIPLPVLTGPQPSVRVESIGPGEYVQYPPRIDCDLGLAYLEIPTEEIKGNLKIEVKFAFTHYGQRFKVNPEKIGEYDRESNLYKRYTNSRGTTRITPAIRKKAREIVGDEKNAFRAARKIYDYVVDKTVYSHMPHAALPCLDIPESVYVHENRFGDCGAQSIYFSALCGAAGIPARSAGGWQMIMPDEPGAHFWAEFYLPNYGWVPVDTSVAQISRALPELSEKQNKEYEDFFFANMDPYRWVIQKDVDIPLMPPASEPPLLPLAIQFPAALCNTMEEIPGLLFAEDWKWKFTASPRR